MLRPARFIVVVVLAAFLTSLPAQALPLRTEGLESRAASLEDWATLALGRLWAFLTKEGGNVDPHGICVAGQACGQQQPAGEEGGIVDPSGGK